MCLLLTEETPVEAEPSKGDRSEVPRPSQVAQCGEASRCPAGPETHRGTETETHLLQGQQTTHHGRKTGVHP